MKKVLIQKILRTCFTTCLNIVGGKEAKDFLHQYLQELFSVLQTHYLTVLITADQLHNVIFQKYKYSYNWSLKTSKISKRKEKKGNYMSLREQSHNFGISMLSKLAMLEKKIYGRWDSQTQFSNAEVNFNFIHSNAKSWTNIVKKIKSNQA